MRAQMIMAGTTVALVVAALGLQALPFSRAASAGRVDPRTLDQDAVAFERPLVQFSEARLISPAPEPMAVPDQPAPEPTPAGASPLPSLRGIVRQGNEPIAWLAFEGGPSRSVGVDEAIGDWRVLQIDETRVLLEAGSRRETVSLFAEP